MGSQMITPKPASAPGAPDLPDDAHARAILDECGMDPETVNTPWKLEILYLFAKCRVKALDELTARAAASPTLADFSACMFLVAGFVDKEEPRLILWAIEVLLRYHGRMRE